MRFSLCKLINGFPAVLFDRDIALCCLTKNKGGIAILFLLIDHDFYDIPLLSE